MEKRFQVFVSSTYQDLQKERQEVMHALLELDCIPSGMELFPAANESQWALIKKVIEDCDYYILILAGRYGSLGPEGFSYTEMEYKYALSINKPIIAFLHKDIGNIPANLCESTDEGKKKLALFRALVEQKHCKHWSTAAELGSVVSRSLIQLTKTTPAIGWVRADELLSKDATLELLKLRKKVDELESELQRVRFVEPKGIEELAKGDDKYILHYTYNKDSSPLSERVYAKMDLEWDKIFSAVAPIMFNDAREADIHNALNRFISEWDAIINNDGEKHNWVHLDNDDFHTIKIQLRSLGLIMKSNKVRSVKDTATYWVLTPYGDEKITRLKAITRSCAQTVPGDSPLRESEGQK